MKKAGWLVLISAIVLLGWQGSLLAASTSVQAAAQVNPAYPAEDAQRIAQPGPGYDQESSATEDEMQVAATAEEQAGPEEAEAYVALKEPGPQPAAPGPDYVWVEPYRLETGFWVPGFWRPRMMAGFVWVNGTWDVKVGAFIPGFWRPRIARAGYVWVPGYWFAGRWVPGLWRPAARPGFIWLGGYWTRGGEWVFGHWRPLHAPAGRVWVPGYWGPRGVWYGGHWRVGARPGYLWRGGHYGRQGEWVPGRWHGHGPDRDRGRGRRHR
jgi:hypothetical protein